MVDGWREFDPENGDTTIEFIKIKWFETSVVDIPANPDSFFSIVEKQFGKYGKIKSKIKNPKDETHYEQPGDGTAKTKTITEPEPVELVVEMSEDQKDASNKAEAQLKELMEKAEKLATENAELTEKLASTQAKPQPEIEPVAVSEKDAATASELESVKAELKAIKDQEALDTKAAELADAKMKEFKAQWEIDHPVSAVTGNAKDVLSGGNTGEQPLSDSDRSKVNDALFIAALQKKANMPVNVVDWFPGGG
jgi:hypothetical protein